MKRYVIYLTLVAIAQVILITTACSKKDDEKIDDEKLPGITMSTDYNGVFEILLKGSGTVTIYWGYGESNTYTLSYDYDRRCSYYYDSSHPRTITITGGDITYLYCSYNQLTALDVSKNTALIELSCEGGLLTTLDVSKNTELKSLNCGGNNLTTLDVRNNPALTFLGCYNNQLTTLDVSNNPALTFLGCQRNLMQAKALNTLFQSLPKHTPPNTSALYIDENPGYNECNKELIPSGWYLAHIIYCGCI